MARSGLDKHRKFGRLSLALHSVSSGMGKIMARGVLETLWSAAYERADDFLGDSDDVEIAVGWCGTRGTLSAMLLESGFVDLSSERGGYVVHDLWDHAPPWVKRKGQLEAARRASGKTISDVRREAGAKGRPVALDRQTVDRLPANGQLLQNGSSGQLALDRQTVDRLPANGQLLPGKSQPWEGKGRDLRTLSPACDPPAATSDAEGLPLAGAGPQDQVDRATAQPWGKAKFIALWESQPTELHLGTTGSNWPVYDEAALLCVASAKKARTAVEEHSSRLFLAFAEMATQWGKRGRSPKGRSVEKFVQHFAAVELWLSGVREAEAPPPDGRRRDSWPEPAAVQEERLPPMYRPSQPRRRPEPEGEPIAFPRSS